MVAEALREVEEEQVPMRSTSVEGVWNLLIDNIDNSNSVEHPIIRLGGISFYWEILTEVL